jgi:ATP-dependent RNA helicase HelY
MVLVTPEDFTELPARLGEIELPRPYAPYERHFQDEVVRRLVRARLVGRDRQGGRKRKEGSARAVAAVSGDEQPGSSVRRADGLWRQVQQHPLARQPHLDQVLRAGARIERFERETAELAKRVDRVADTVARRFQRLLGLLERWGCVEGWALTQRGELLARCYHECDLLIVECMARGYLDDLEPAELAAFLSCFSYEHRSRTAPQQSWLPSAVTRERYRELQELHQRLADQEEQARLPVTRPPDATFAGLAYAWAAGGDLEDVLGDEEVSGGDFVRNVKQLLDLCRQVGELAPVPATARSARRAADLLFRGVVAASSVVEVDDDIPDLDEVPEPLGAAFEASSYDAELEDVVDVEVSE